MLLDSFNRRVLVAGDQARGLESLSTFGDFRKVSFRVAGLLELVDLLVVLLADDCCAHALLTLGLRVLVSLVAELIYHHCVDTSVSYDIDYNTVLLVLMKLNLRVNQLIEYLLLILARQRVKPLDLLHRLLHTPNG